MTSVLSMDAVLPNTLVPVSLVQHTGRFNGVPEQDCLRGDLVFCNGTVAGMKPPSQSAAPRRMILPRLTECHVHLDKCHTIHRMEGVGGDLMSAITAQAEDRKTWTSEDIRARARSGLEELAEAGCGNVRTHVDWGGDGDAGAVSVAWQVLDELAQETRGAIRLQIAPLIGVDELQEQGFADTIARRIAQSGGVLGGFVLNQPNRRSGIAAAVRAADKHGLALDFHVDEGLEAGLDGLEVIADVIIETGYQGPVLCGHACSLMNRDKDSLKKLAEKLVCSGITVGSLPTTNLYLQGRTAGTPDRRGITRITELRAMGVPVVVGTDNVRDAFCPLGRHDPRQSLAQAAIAAHLDPPFGSYLPMITTEAEKALGLAPTFIDGAAHDDLIVFNTGTTAGLLAGVRPPMAVSAVLQGEPA